MRTNLPVTQVEYPVGDDVVIVSKTDTKGKLVYFNEEFVKAAGFTEAELIDSRTTSSATRTCPSRHLRISGAR